MMNKRVILARYGELHLKGKNRGFFEKTLIRNIERALKGIELKADYNYNRYVFSEYNLNDENIITGKLAKIFGLHSYSIAYVCESDFDKIATTAFQLCKPSGKFRVNTNRADKTFERNSMRISADTGAYILERNKKLEVDLHNPDFSINIDVRENRLTYVYTDSIHCGGGLPVGTSGTAMLMLSGGIDSPVAGYLMAKRGMKIKAVHFCSPPYTSEQALDKVKDLAAVLTGYVGSIELFTVPFTKIQESIHKSCDESFMITIMRRIMMRLSERLCSVNGCQAIITGESLGQVASQTVESITATNAVSGLPVFRPLIAFDKSEIIEIAKKINTFNISVKPFDDCCTVFLPKFPQIKPRLNKVEFEESKLDIDSLVNEALSLTETVIID